MRELAARGCYLLCLGLGRLLRASTYSRTRIARDDGVLCVRKQRRLHAPLLIRLARPLVQVLDTGVRVLSRRDWAERERRLYRSLYGASIRIDGDGALVLPCFAGETLATLLEDPALDEAARRRAIELAVVALADFHHRGFTHGDAMAENVIVDRAVSIARWFDFETQHDPGRSLAWRRADDMRALLATTLLRTGHAEFAETLHLILDLYADEEVTRLLAGSFNPVCRRPLTFHLSQAALSFASYRKIARLLSERAGD